MSRIINIYHHLSPSEKAKGLYNIELNSLDQELVNYSNNIIHCDCLEYIENSYTHQAIDSIFKKVRINGSLIITFNNYKNICLSYANGILKDEEFILLMKNKKNILSINSIKKILQNIPGTIIYKTENIENEYKTTITINRISL